MPASIGHVAAGAGRDDDLLGLVGERHDRLGAVDHIVVAVTGGAGADAVQRVVGIGFFVGQRGDHGPPPMILAIRAFCASLPAWPGRSRPAPAVASAGLDHQAAAQGFKHDGHVKACAAKTAIGLREQGANQRPVRQSGPQRRGRAVVAVRRCGCGFRCCTARPRSGSGCPPACGGLRL